MGLFDETVTVYGVVPIPLIQEQLLPNSTTTALLRGIRRFTNASINTEVLEELAKGIAIGSERFAIFGKSAEYPYGGRYGGPTLIGFSEALVATALESIEGPGVSVLSAKASPPDLNHVAWLHLIDSYGYSQTTNIISSLGAGYYLENFQIVLPEDKEESLYVTKIENTEMFPTSDAGYAPGRRIGQLPDTLSTEGAPLPIIFDPAVSVPSVLVRYRWESPAGVYNFGDFQVSLPYTDEEEYYVHARYTVAGVIKYWFYRLGEGTFTALDTVRIPPDYISEGREFYPVVYFRRNSVNLSDDVGTPAFEASTEILRALGASYAELGASIHDSPDIGKIKDAYLDISVPFNSEKQVCLKYLFDYFKWFIEASLGVPDISGVSYSVTAYDAQMEVSDTELRTHWSTFARQGSGTTGIFHSVHTGVVAPVGQYVRLFTNTVFANFGYQISETVYHKIELIGYKVFYWLNTRTKSSIIEFKPKDSRLVIPINRYVIKDYTLAEKEELLSNSLHLIFLCQETIELEWYETSFFTDVLTIGSAIIGNIGLNQLLTSLTTAITTGTLSFAVKAFLVEAFTQWAIYEALKLFVKEVGLDESLAVAAGVMLAGAAVGLAPNAIPGLPTAESFLRLGTNLTKAIGGRLQDLTADTQRALKAFNKEAETKMTELEDLLEEINPTKHLWMVPMLLEGETPDQFYTRTIHSGNIGVKSLSTIGSYVQNSLRLPTPEQTLGGFNYGF